MRLILNQASSRPAFGTDHHPRWIVGILAVSMMFGMAAAFGTAQNTVAYEGKISEVIEQISTPSPDPVEVTDNLHVREIRIQRGDTVSSLLTNLGVDDQETTAFLRNDLRAGPVSRQLVPGKTLLAKVTQGGELESLIFPLNGEKDSALVIQRTTEGLSATTQRLPVEQKLAQRTATIQHSLFGAADEAGIPDSVAVQLADIFGGDIDFHRDLRKGDRFSVIYETGSHLGKTVGTPRILAAEFINDGKTYRAYWYQSDNAHGGYYTEAGRSIRKAFLRSPLEFSRITSGFSNARYHPVLRETRAHHGIDYGAPTGTRVKTTGDGVIEFAGIQGGYGKVVIIRHPGDRTTVYGHLSGFVPGLRKGMRVSQGEVVGFVGATGIATGPHLHYEFRVAGVHRNPLTVALPDAAPLPTAQIAAYKSFVADLSNQIDSIRDIQLALLD